MDSGEFTCWFRAPVQGVKPGSCPRSWEIGTGTNSPCGRSHWSRTQNHAASRGGSAVAPFIQACKLYRKGKFCRV